MTLCVYRLLKGQVKAMLGYLILLTVASRTLGKNCIRDFYEAEEMIVNGSLGPLLSTLSDAFYPTSEKQAEHLLIQYLYSLNCSDAGSLNYTNHTMEYVWAMSSVYLVVDPDTLNDLTCDVVDVTQGSLSINLECMCPSYPNDVTDILSRLTAYLRCYAKSHTKPQRDDDCKINSFIRRHESRDPLYEKVHDVINTVKAVTWISLILMLCLQLKLLNTLYIYVQHHQSDSFSIAWATFFIGAFLFVILLKSDVDSRLVDCNSKSSSDYKELYVGIYFTWSIGLLAAFYSPKYVTFPVPILTSLFCVLKMTHTRLFHVLTFIVQSLMIWILFCLIQLMTLHGIFFLVALLAKPVGVLVALAYIFTFIALAISGTSIMFEVVSLERINPFRVRTAFNSYRRDLLNIHTSMMLPIFLVALMFLSYQFANKLGSTIDFTGAPAAIVGVVQSIVFFVLSIALRQKKFRQIFDEVKDDSHHKFVYNDNISSKGYVAIDDD